jgi:hypothetical protein
LIGANRLILFDPVSAHANNCCHSC